MGDRAVRRGGRACGCWTGGAPRHRTATRRARWVPVVAGVLAVVAVVGTVQQVVRVGHAGAEATWNGVVSSSPTAATATTSAGQRDDVAAQPQERVTPAPPCP